MFMHHPPQQGIAKRAVPPLPICPVAVVGGAGLYPATGHLLSQDEKDQEWQGGIREKTGLESDVGHVTSLLCASVSSSVNSTERAEIPRGEACAVSYLGCTCWTGLVLAAESRAGAE